MHGAISNFFPCFSLPFQCNFQGVNDVLHFCRQSCRSEHTWQGWSGSVGNTVVCQVFSIFSIFHSIDNIPSRTCWGKNFQRWRGRLRLPKMNLMPKRSKLILLKKNRKRKWRNKTKGLFDFEKFRWDVFLPPQDVLLSWPDEEAHEEKGAGGSAGAQQTGDSCWRGGSPFQIFLPMIIPDFKAEKRIRKGKIQVYVTTDRKMNYMANSNAR